VSDCGAWRVWRDVAENVRKAAARQPEVLGADRVEREPATGLTLGQFRAGHNYNVFFWPIAETVPLSARCNIRIWIVLQITLGAGGAPLLEGVHESSTLLSKIENRFCTYI
jgi:hypothetical protein